MKESDNENNISNIKNLRNNVSNEKNSFNEDIDDEYVYNPNQESEEETLLEIKKFVNSKSVDTKSPVENSNNFYHDFSQIDGSFSMLKNQGCLIILLDEKHLEKFC